MSLVHETANELLHKAELRTMTAQTGREKESEAVAFIVGQAVGLEMGNASNVYIQTYAGNATLLAESLEVIQRTASTILRAVRLAEASAEQFAAVSQAPSSERVGSERAHAAAILDRSDSLVQREY